MSYEIREGYPKLKTVDKNNNALAEEYKSKFTDVNADIGGAQALIDDDPTSEDYNGDLVFNADKLNAICESLDDLQPPFINAKGTLAEWMTNFNKETTEYSITQTYNYGETVTYQDNTYLCINKNVTGTFDITKWAMLTPSDLGFDITDIDIREDNNILEIYLNDEKVAQVFPDIIYLEDEDNAQNGMVYLIQKDGIGDVEIRDDTLELETRGYRIISYDKKHIDVDTGIAYYTDSITYNSTTQEYNGDEVQGEPYKELYLIHGISEEDYSLVVDYQEGHQWYVEYLAQVAGIDSSNRYILKYKNNSGYVVQLSPETNANVCLHQQRLLQNELNGLNEWLERGVD